MSATSSRHTPIPAGAGPNAWIAFAGIVLFLNGVFGFLFGLAAVLNDKVVTVGGSGGPVVWEFGTLSAFPLWSILVIALDVLIIYQLVARWQLQA